MRDNSSTGDLAPLDLEIEATCRRNNAERRRKALQERTIQLSVERTLPSELSSAFPADLRESEVGASEAHIMANEQPQRVTLEDYSNSTVPQFFISIVQPKVQAHNISYPYSLI